jgi:hypothetical protein
MGAGMGQVQGRFRRMIAQGRVPLGLSLSLLALAWVGGATALLVQRACIRKHVGRPVRRLVSREGYTLLLVFPERFNPSTCDQIVACFFSVYPRQAARFNPGAPRAVTLVLEPAEGFLETGPTLGKVLHQSNLYLTSKPQDIDVVTFNFFRAVQGYPEGKYPAWVCDGLADYARYTYGINNAAAGWSLGGYSPKQHYTDSYAVTARFFVWLEKRVDARVLEDLDAALRGGTYTDAFWRQRTGRTVDQLWTAYGADSAL